MGKLAFSLAFTVVLASAVSADIPAKAAVQPTNPSVQTGLSINVNGHTATVLPGSVYLNDKLISLSAPKQLQVQAAAAKTERLDTLYVDSDGLPSIVTGHPSKMAPEPAVVPSGGIPLAHVHVQGTADLSDNDVLPISRDCSNLFFSDRVKNERALSQTLSKLKNNAPVKLMFWGDSITCGANATSPEFGYASLTEKMIRQRFHPDHLLIKNLGIGGSSVDTRLDKLEFELQAFHPDMMVIEFVNDLRVKPDPLESSYKKVDELVQKYNVEVLYVNPFLPSPALCGLHTYSEVAKVSYYQFVRDTADKNGWALADVAKRWEGLDQEGLNGDLLLADAVVHLNNQGHHMLAEEVFKCFR